MVATASRIEIGKVLDTKIDHCDKHGEFESKLLQCFGDKKLWTSCENCIEEKRKLENEAFQKEIQENIKRASIERRLGNACIPPRFQSKGFGNFKSINELQNRVLQNCIDYAKNFPEHHAQGRCLMLLGKVGTGKTHLASAIANYIVSELGYTALYITVSALIRHIRATFGNDAEYSEKDAYELFSEPDLLVIDEIGVQKGSDFELSTLFEVINSRYEKMLPTLIISNGDPEDLKTYLGDRVVDRLCENKGKFILFQWESARVKA